MHGTARLVRLVLLGTLLLPLLSCGQIRSATGVSYALSTADPLASYALTGATHRVLDPSLIRQGTKYFLFSTDVAGASETGSLRVRCSPDKIAWRACGAVFPEIPAWVRAAVPGVVGLWAPDVSFFNGLYHVYYAASTLGSQRSVIGLATNTTLDQTDPAFRWVDRGMVLGSVAGDDFNAIDPNILVDADGSIYLTYGSYWSGIKQVQVDPNTGEVLDGATRYDLASRPAVAHHPLEGASLVHHGNFYYLFVSIDYCCTADYRTDNYKQAVGRSTSPQGPFSDIAGTAMLEGGATVILQGNADWLAPGGGTASLDPETGEDTLVFHALHANENGTQYVWIKPLQWLNGWPSL